MQPPAAYFSYLHLSCPFFSQKLKVWAKLAGEKLKKLGFGDCTCDQTLSGKPVARRRSSTACTACGGIPDKAYRTLTESELVIRSRSESNFDSVAIYVSWNGTLFFLQGSSLFTVLDRGLYTPPSGEGEPGWLKSFALDGYTSLLQQGAKCSGASPETILLDTLWSEMLKSDGLKAGRILARILRKNQVSWGDVKYINFNISELNAHYVNVDVDVSSKTPLDMRKIREYNSMAGGGQEWIVSAINDALSQVTDGRRSLVHFGPRSLRLPVVPQQVNGDDCGISALTYQRAAALNRRTTKVLTPAHAAADMARDLRVQYLGELLQSKLEPE